MITVTIDKINGVDVTNDIRGIQSSDVVAGSLRPLTANNTATAALFKIKSQDSNGNPIIQDWQVTETYAAVQSALTADIQDGAPINSPTFTGVPSAPTAAPSTNTTQIATTAFVAALGALKEDTANKNAANGYAGINSNYAIQLNNVANTFISILRNTNTAVRTYLLPDTSGEVVVGSTGATVTFVAGVGVVTFTGAPSEASRVKAGSRVILQEITNTNASAALGVAYTVTNVAATSCTITMLDATGATETDDVSTRNCLVLF